ncbi:MAG TPA: hypothetical protein VN814_02000 [Caulobacteraceae bacterium]|nr:hypothetical protein [Caulobacteraceae bacterium]
MTRPSLTAAALAISLIVAGAAAAEPAANTAAADTAEVRQICAADFQKACPDAKPGNGALKACAKAHFMSFSRPCKTELKAMRARLQHSGQTNATS